MADIAGETDGSHRPSLPGVASKRVMCVFTVVLALTGRQHEGASSCRSRSQWTCVRTPDFFLRGSSGFPEFTKPQFPKRILGNSMR